MATDHHGQLKILSLYSTNPFMISLRVICFPTMNFRIFPSLDYIAGDRCAIKPPQ